MRKLDGGAANTLATLRRVPLLYYRLQWPVAHGLALALTVLAGHPAAHLLADSMDPAFHQRGPGFGLPVVYLC